MATMATFFRRPGAITHSQQQSRSATAARAAADPYRLRALPNEDVFLFSKQIDNSRVVREADPKAHGECWSTIGAACVVVALLTSVLAPAVGSTLAGYRLESLKQEEQRLIDERRVLEVEEARLLNPARLEELARGQKLSTPAAGQVIHLDPKADGSLALNVKKE
jgi:cell division protein FtsL